MLKPLFTAAAVMLAACGPGASAQTAEGPVTADWTIQESGKSPAEGKVQFSISRRPENSQWIHSNTAALADLQGLASAQLASENGAPVRFRVDRETGSLDCEGIVRRRRGTGECSLTFLGVRDLPAADLVRLRDHGVSTSFIRDHSSHGLHGLAVADLVRLRDHGVSARFVGDLRQLGYSGLSTSEIVKPRSHGVTSDFIRRANVDGRRSVDELVRMRSSG